MVNMETYVLDELDKKILYELGKDSRQSYKQIARNIKSKKESVAYHMKNLIDKGIVTKFVPVFALSKLGIFTSKIYLKLQGLTKDTEEKLYSQLVKDKEVSWIAKSVGYWDLLLGFYSVNPLEFSQAKDKILSKFSKYIEGYDITQMEAGLVFIRDYLVEKSTNYRKEFEFVGELEDLKLTEKEKKIINLVRNNGRFQIIDIADKLNVDSRTILRILKSLEKKKILQGFTAFIDLRKIGFQLHKLCISIKDYDEKKIGDFISFLKSNPHTIHLIKALGSWEFEVEMEYNNLEGVYEYIQELKNKFPAMIKKIDLVTITDELKLEFFPENL